MSKIKSIPKADVEKLINELEKGLTQIDKFTIGQRTHNYAGACGYAEGLIEGTIKKLKGEYPI